MRPYDHSMSSTDARSFASQYMEQGKERVLAEVHPLASQLQQGLELHADATVVDVYCGSTFINWRAGFFTEPMLNWAKQRMEESPPERESDIHRIIGETISGLPPLSWTRRRADR